VIGNHSIAYQHAQSKAFPEFPMCREHRSPMRAITDISCGWHGLRFKGLGRDGYARLFAAHGYAEAWACGVCELSAAGGTVGHSYYGDNESAAAGRRSRHQSSRG
jgi:hypothetical protein